MFGTGLLVFVLANTLALLADLPVSLVGSIIALVGAVSAGAVTALASRRTARETRDSMARQREQDRELGLIHAGQDTLLSVIEQQRLEMSHQRETIERLRKQVDRIPRLEEHIRAMRGELAEALSHHSECETRRQAQEQIIAELRRRLGGIT
jgi:chromosome segregation ATPase